MNSLITGINPRKMWLTLTIYVAISGILPLGLGEALNIDITPNRWLACVIVEIGLMAAVVTILYKRNLSSPSFETKQYEHNQTTLLQQLEKAQDLRTRQLILDTMMGEDLLHGADLSNMVLVDIHLENANLEHAHLQHAMLPKADLEGANLQSALLNEADLNRADLVHANLCHAELQSIHLEGAVLADANLSCANLKHALLRGASLYDANLNNVQMDYADLRGCCMLYADLLGATFQGTLFDEYTVLPDGERWTPQSDVSRFTNEAHPQYVPYKDLDSPVAAEKTA